MIRSLLSSLFILAFATAVQADVKPLTPPDCATGGSEYKTISVNADWNDINSTTFKYFCVDSGNYISFGTITLTQAGTDGDERWIIYNGNAIGTHPALQADGDRAKVAKFQVNSGFWIVQEITVIGTASRLTVIEFGTSGDDNVFHRILVDGGGGGGGHVNVSNADRVHFQNSVFRETEKRTGDSHCFKGAIMTDIHIISSEIYNCAGDAIQPGGNATENAAGWLIEDNDIYIDDTMYTNCSGTLDPDGACAHAENGFDAKDGPVAANPTASEINIFRGNRVFGFQKPDYTGSSGQGDALVCQQECRYWKFEDNIVFDSRAGWATANGPLVENNSLINNLFFNMELNLLGCCFSNLANAEFYYNTLIDSGSCCAHWTGGGGADHEARCNVLIESNDAGSSTGNADSDFNAYYDVAVIDPPEANSIERADDTLAANGDLQIIIKRITNPTVHTISNAITTPASPHFNLCNGLTIGGTVDRGVDDTTTYDRPHAGFIPPFRGQHVPPGGGR